MKHNKRYLEKWSSDLHSTLDQARLLKQTSYVFQYTNDINLRWFNYKIAHRILATNDYLFKIKIRNSNLCSFCGNEVETLKHLFISCELVDNIWTLLQQWIYEKCGFLLNYSKLELLFGKIGNIFSAPNTIVILVKHYICRQRLKGELLIFESIKRTIYDYYIMERHIDTINNRLDIFRKNGRLLTASSKLSSLSDHNFCSIFFPKLIQTNFVDLLSDFISFILTDCKTNYCYYFLMFFY